MSLDLIEEGKFRYVKVGEGKPLILLHGLFGALSNFQDVINGFSNDLQWVVSDALNRCQLATSEQLVLRGGFMTQYQEDEL